MGIEDDDHVRVLAAVTDADFDVRNEETSEKVTPAQRANAAFARSADYPAAYGYPMGSKPVPTAVAPTGPSLRWPAWGA